MAKKDQLVVLNATVPLALKKFAEHASKEKNFSSLSDYIRSLIRNDQKKSIAADLENLIDAIMNYLHGGFQQDNVISSTEGIEIIKNKLATISSLFELGVNLKTTKIKRENPKISKKALLKKLNAWSLSYSGSEEVPGFIEISEERKQRLLNG